MNTASQRAVLEICAYLQTGMHYSTIEGQIALAAIVARHLHTQAVEQSRFWEDCTRDVVRDKDQQILILTNRSSVPG